MRIDRSAFQRATGYRVLQEAGGTAQVEVPGKARPVELPLEALEQMQRAAEALAGAAPAATGPLAGIAARTGAQLRADLNRSLFDASPLTITDAEVRHAHRALLRTPPGALSQVIAELPDEMLNGYLTRLAEAEPFRLDGPPAALPQLATKLALELDPEVGAALVARLQPEARMRLVEGILGMPSSALVEEMRATLGDEGFRDLVKGSRADSLVGRGLASGRCFDENVTEVFKARYAEAASGELPLPAGADDVVYLGGPGLLGDQLPGYLEPNFRALEEWGVPAENTLKLDYNTAADPRDNADAIFAQVKAQKDKGKRVVVLGHSKFGRDMLEAFARHPELKDMVDGALLMQPALTAQVAKDLALPEMSKLLDPVLGLVGGERAAFDGLSSEHERLPAWPAEVPTVVMASSTESPKALLKPVAEHYYEHFYGAASDGLVAFQDQATVEGAAVVTLPGLADHAQPGLKFRDLCEHFAEQIDAGAPDEGVAGMLERLRAMTGSKIVDVAVEIARRGLDTPAERARLSDQLRAVGPALDRFARGANRAVGYELVDNEAMTRALVSQLFDRMAG